MSAQNLEELLEAEYVDPEAFLLKSTSGNADLNVSTTGVNNSIGPCNACQICLANESSGSALNVLLNTSVTSPICNYSKVSLC